MPKNKTCLNFWLSPSTRSTNRSKLKSSSNLLYRSVIKKGP